MKCRDIGAMRIWPESRHSPLAPLEHKMPRTTVLSANKRDRLQMIYGKFPGGTQLASETDTGSQGVLIRIVIDFEVDFG